MFDASHVYLATPYEIANHGSLGRVLVAGSRFAAGQKTWASQDVKHKGILNMRMTLTSVGLVTMLANCDSTDGNRTDPDSYWEKRHSDKIRQRMLEAVNLLRERQGLPPLEIDAALNAAASRHARDISVQGRPWNFGADGTSPIDRVRQTGYGGFLVGELVSETYEDEIETLAAWQDDSRTNKILLHPEAIRFGLGWFQETSGKFWWTMVLGGPHKPARV